MGAVEIGLKDPTKKRTLVHFLLMNMYAKLFSKVPANKIKEHNKSIIQHDQLSFITGMQGSSNILKSFFLNHSTNQLKGAGTHDHCNRC